MQIKVYNPTQDCHMHLYVLIDKTLSSTLYYFTVDACFMTLPVL